MITGEQLSAYLAGELDADERAAVEDALDRDPDLRARLARLRAADDALRSLPQVTPPAGFSDRLHDALDREMSDRGDELARRRRPRTEAFRPLAVAAAAAAVIALFGVAGVWLMQGGGADQAGDRAAAPMGVEEAGTRIPITVTDNDFDEQQLRRLAVNVDIRELVSPGLEAQDARPLAEDLQAELRTLNTVGSGGEAAAEAPGDDAVDITAEQEALQDTDGSTAREGAAETTLDATSSDPEDVVARCLPTVLEDARSPLIPVYVELARFDGEPAVVYTLVSEDPDSGTYRRVEVWALARSDCQVLSFAQYDRE